MGAKSSFRHAPRQERSRKSAERILRAAEQLLEERGDFSSVTVVDIARAAGTTTGGFYARFASKEAVIISLFQDLVIKEFMDLLRPTLSKEACADKSIYEIVHSYLSILADMFQRHGAVYAYMGPSVRMDTNLEEAKRLATELNRECTEGLRARILEKRDQIGHPDPEFAVDLANLSSDYLLYHKICTNLSTVPFSNVNLSGVDRVIDELSRSFCKYLEVQDAPKK